MLSTAGMGADSKGNWQFEQGQFTYRLPECILSADMAWFSVFQATRAILFISILQMNIFVYYRFLMYHCKDDS